MKETFKNKEVKGTINIDLGHKKWTADKGEIAQAMVRIAQDYRSQGYTLTLRQMYYQLVSKDIIPNHDKVYAKLSSIKDECCYTGLIDWDSFEDRGRVPHQRYYEESKRGALERTIESYRLDRQEGQKNHIEVWTEKDAISSIIKRVTSDYILMTVVNKGYSSSTAMYQAYTRFRERIEAGQKVKILYFGDHDPSGLDMIRDIRDRSLFFLCFGDFYSDNYDKLDKFWEAGNYTIYDMQEESFYDFEKIGTSLANFDREPSDEAMKAFDAFKVFVWLRDNELFEVIPVGLTKRQIKQYNPPPNPAKITDPRAKWYIAEHGQVSWEVDALSPSIMETILQDNIVRLIDQKLVHKIREQEKKDIEDIKKIIN